MSEELVTITVDGQELKAPKGAMLIEVTDRENIHVPRFCYHEKLSVAANCRMCLVEVEKAPKPLPACATPVMDGMVVHTYSAAAKKAQQSVMEFLLINHPLDCPICDQGGECELQDVAMGYGRDVSQYVEGKRVVLDKNIGPLIATELTRCIHCTRCVRFGTEIAGIREMGMTARGENARIATYMSQAVTSEMSGNVIDLCPVGALTAKPSRFAARAWEMVQHASIAPHDCVGSNLFVHTLREEVIRVVPRDNEAINEAWISDRDRFSYEGIYSDDRLIAPMIKKDGEWKQVDWDTALGAAIEVFKKAVSEARSQEQGEEPSPGASPLYAIISPSSTLEELYLTQKLMRSLGSGNIDHRLRQTDFSDQDSAPVMPWLGQNIDALENIDAALLIGSNVRKEQPILAHRLRKAVINNHAEVSFINPRRYEFNFPVSSNISTAQQNLAHELAGVAAEAFKLSKNTIPAHLKSVLSGQKPKVEHKAIANQLKKGKQTTVLLGNSAAMHPDFSVLRALAEAIAKETGSTLGYLTEGGNSAGAWLAGAVPHRGPAGETENIVTGVHMGALDAVAPTAALLVNLEPDADCINSHMIMSALDAAGVVAVSSYDTAALRAVADVLLPAATFTETSGTYVNAEGAWQSFNGVNKPMGDARPGWKVLRVLGSLLHNCHVCETDCEFMSSEEVRNELRALCEDIQLNNDLVSPKPVELVAREGLMRSGDVPIYSGDGILRRATSLQKTKDAQTICVSVNAEEAGRLKLGTTTKVRVSQGERSTELDLVIDDSVPNGSAWIPMAVEGNGLLGDAFGVITLESAGDA